MLSRVTRHCLISIGMLVWGWIPGLELCFLLVLSVSVVKAQGRTGRDRRALFKMVLGLVDCSISIVGATPFPFCPS